MNKEGGPGADDGNSSRRTNIEASNVEIDELDEDLNLTDADDQFLKDTEDQKMMQDYYVWDTQTSSMNVTLASLENDPLVKNHIVVCGIHSAIKSFIMPLRAKYLKDI